MGTLTGGGTLALPARWWSGTGRVQRHTVSYDRFSEIAKSFLRSIGMADDANHYEAMARALQHLHRLIIGARAAVPAGY